MAQKKTVYSKNIVQASRLSDHPAFRFPDAQIEGLPVTGRTSQIDLTQDAECLPEPPPARADIGVPEDLMVEGQPRIVKKGTTSFVDVDISFIPAEGATRHQFRISKIVREPVEQGEGEGEG